MKAPEEIEQLPAAGALVELLARHRLCICAGPGGVGKTTTAAALALGAAARGAKVAVVTIDPARRLANALGLAELGNEPRPVEPDLLHDHGVQLRGELWAMMLDSKRTFDELVTRLAPDESAREEVLGNRIYKQLSDAVAGSHEFTAIAKLYELDQEGGFDLIVLDTPPSRDALDFLDAPDRLSQFFEGRALQLFLRPTGLGMRLFGRGTSVVFALLRRLTGVDLLEDLSEFFGSLAGMIDGFKERARHVGALLSDPGTTFVLVTSPGREPVEETVFFRHKLAAAGMPFGAAVVNRAHPGSGVSEGDAVAVTAALSEWLGAELAGTVDASLRDQQALAERDRASLRRLAQEIDVEQLTVVPDLDEDVHDIAGLARIADFLFAPDHERARLARELLGS